MSNNNKKDIRKISNKKAEETSVHKDAERSRRLKILLFVLILITITAFANTIRNEFLTWDDKDYVTENQYIKDFSPSGIETMFTVFVSCHYHPLTLLSLAIDYSLWGNNSSGFILTNILLHILNTVLVLLIFYKLTNKFEIAFITALIFAVHPMKVESVVWIAERKDVLFSFFYLLSVLFYIRYIKSGFKIKHYFFTFSLFVFSLLSKASATSLPLLLFLFDYFLCRKDIKKIILEKIPFLILSLIFGIVAIKAQSLAPPNNPPFIDRIFLVTYAFTFYLLKFIAPFLQSAVIPFPESVKDLLPLKYYVSILIIPSLGFIIYKFRNIRKEIVFALTLFLLTLIMVLIKFPIGPAYLAERYTYLPYIGLGYLVGFMYYKYKSTHKLDNSFKNNFFVILVFYCLFLIIKTIDRNTVWKDSYTLFSDVISKNPTYSFALNNRANALALQNKHAQALEDYNLAIKYKPDFAEAYNNRATSLFALKDYKSVLNDLNTSIKLSPDNPKIADMYNNRGLAYFHLDKFNEAIPDFNKAITLNKKNLEPYKSRMNCYIAIKEYDKAIDDLSYIMSIEKEDADHYNQKGILCAEKNDFPKAVLAFNEALRLKPNNSSFYFNRGFAYLQIDIEKACTDFSKSASLNNEAAKAIFQERCKK